MRVIWLLAIILGTSCFHGAVPALAQAKPEPSGNAKSVKLKPDLAYGAFQDGRYLTAKKEAEERLKKQPQDIAAITLLGEIYSQGLGVPANPMEAAKWYEKAANLGDSHAMTTLGLMMIAGAGVEKNTSQGKLWLEQATAKGNPLASYNLGLLLLSSRNPVDVGHAAILIRTAADVGIPDAQYALGVLYLRGRGVEKDPSQAAKWFLRGAENDNLASEVEYAILAFKGEGMAANPELAAKYFRRAAYRGNAIAQNRLARMYAIGRGVQKDRVEAATWHMLAVSKGLADAWLDADLRDLNQDDRARAERLMRDRMTTQ